MFSFSSMEKRDQKKLIIILVYAVIFILILIPIVLRIIPSGTCSDGKQNQNEEGVDCGGVCQQKCKIQIDDRIVIKEVGFIETNQTNKYDVYGEILNPNKEVGASNFDYIFVLKDSSDNIVAQREGAGFIFPGEAKYLIEIGMESGIIPEKVSLEIKNISWKDFSGAEKPQFAIVNKNYNGSDPELDVSNATGLLKNESPFDFNEIAIKVILKDENGNVIAVNATKINTVQAGENREFKVLWPNKLSRSVSNMVVQAEANVFGSEAFIKAYFPGQSF